MMEGSTSHGGSTIPIIRMFEEAEEAGLPARLLAERDRDYRDHKQWSPQERAAFRKRGQPVVTFSRIGRKIDFLLGLEAQMRRDPKAFPRNPGDEGAAQAATDALRFVCDDCEWDVARSAAMENLLVEGSGAVMVGGKKSREGVDPSLIHIPWDRLFWDPHSRRLDFADASYMGIVTWMDAAEAKALYPHAAAVIDATLEASRTIETYDDRPKWKVWADHKRKRIRLIEGYYLAGGAWRMCVATKAGEIVPPQPSPYLDEEGRPENPIKAVSYYVDRNNDRYGGVRAMIDPQDEINQRRSKALHLITMRQSRVDRAAGIAPEDVRSALAKPDGVVVAGKGEFEILATNDMAAANLQMLKEAKAEIDLLGPNAALQGKNENDMSGRAILAQQQGGMVEVAMLFDRLRMLSLAVYRSAWARVRQYWTEERWVRVTDDERNLRFVGLNRRVTALEAAQAELMAAVAAGAIGSEEAELRLALAARDPASRAVVRIENRPAALDVDIVIDEGMDTPTVQAEQFDTLSRIMPGIVNLPLPLVRMLVMASSLRDKDRMLEELERMEGTAPRP